jgi:hypothetical protein
MMAMSDLEDAWDALHPVTAGVLAVGRWSRKERLRRWPPVRATQRTIAGVDRSMREAVL